MKDDNDATRARLACVHITCLVFIMGMGFTFFVLGALFSYGKETSDGGIFYGLGAWSVIETGLHAGMIHAAYKYRSQCDSGVYTSAA